MPDGTYNQRRIFPEDSGTGEEDKKDLRLPYCGSTNQRVIDVQESLKEGKVVLWEN